MLVGKKEFQSVLEKFKKPGLYAVDCETTGLFPYNGDRLFSIILCDENNEAYYFNFNEQQDPNEPSLLPRSLIKDFQEIFDVPESTWIGHNLKFDMHILAMEGLEIKGKLACTMVRQRLIYNRSFNYDLDTCVKPLGLSKSDAVWDHIMEHGLWEWEKTPGKKTRSKRPFFAKVPLNVMVPYGKTDTIITRTLKLWQDAEFVRKKTFLLNKRKEQVKLPIYTDLIPNEEKLLRTCFEMERHGILIDTVYCEKAIEYEQRRLDDAMALFKQITNTDFVDSRVTLKEAFEKAGETIHYTEKKNASFNDDVLETYTSPAANTVKVIRDASKRINTYFRNYIKFVDDDNYLHYDLKQAGTDTGRFSCADPNLQNVPKPDNDVGEFPIRKAFIPPEDYCLVRIDYDQVEYRLMLNYAQEMGVIKKIKEEGLDVHQATAEMMGVSRNAAKTLNFLLLYGGGIEKLAGSLGISVPEAADLRERYFSNLPAISKWTRGVKKLSARYLFIVNWFGRVCEFIDSSESYKAPNHLIQGGVAEIIKIAMNRTHEHLRSTRSKQVLQVHDELLFYVHKAELGIVSSLVKIMESVYTKGALPLTVGVSHSWHNWHEKIEGCPSL